MKKVFEVEVVRHESSLEKINKMESSKKKKKGRAGEEE
jgi:hypothetical protein